LFDVGS